MTDQPPEVTISPARKVFFTGASFVWLIPILALIVALGVAWQSYNDRGPVIVVEFANGAGIAAGETELKYRDITVGKVEKVGFTPDLAKVKATIRLDKEVAPFVDDGSVFWVVTPKVTAQGITGLSTVLSGVYIEGSWDEQIGDPAFSFLGADDAPLIRPGRSGLQLAFRTGPNSLLTDEAPILFKGIEVGQIGRAKIAPRGNFAIVEAVIFEEHRNLVNSNTRFWDTSGFDVSIGPSGAEIDFSSIATLVGGGITFDTFVSGGSRVPDGTVFEIFPDKSTARNSVFNDSEVDPLKLNVIFSDNLAGLTVGAPVELAGVNIGEVEALSGIVDYNQFGDSRVRLNVTLSIQPARLGLPDEVTADAALSLLQERVANGLRARLATTSILTGGLKVEMVIVDDAPAARIAVVGNDLPQMPTTFSETSDAAATVEGVFNRINGLPIEELLRSAIGFLNAAEVLISDGDLAETPSDVRALLADIKGLVTSQDVQNIPVALNATLTRIEGLVADLEEAQLAQRLVAALDSVGATADKAGTALEGVPELITAAQAVVEKANALAVEDLVAEATKIMTSADQLLTSEDVTAIPTALRAAFEDVAGVLRELRDGGIVADISQTMASARTASGNLAVATEDLPQMTAQLRQVLTEASEVAASVNSSVEGVPELIARIQAVAVKAEALEFQELFAELTNLTRSADAVIGTDAAVALPGSLKAALDEVNYTLQTLREGGAVENVNRTLASARNAADNIATSAQDLPALLERMTRLLGQAGRTIEGFNQGEQLSRSAQDTLRDISKAADALAKLARTIERNPNSLLLGR